MKTNVEKVLERDQKLSELDDRAGWLQNACKQVLKILLPVGIELSIDNGDASIDIEYIY